MKSYTKLDSIFSAVVKLKPPLNALARVNSAPGCPSVLACARVSPSGAGQPISTHAEWPVDWGKGGNQREARGARTRRCVRRGPRQRRQHTQTHTHTRGRSERRGATSRRSVSSMQMDRGGAGEGTKPSRKRHRCIAETDAPTQERRYAFSIANTHDRTGGLGTPPKNCATYGKEWRRGEGKH